MLARGRLKIKPNLAKGAKTQKKVEPVEEVTSTPAEKLKTEPCSSQLPPTSLLTVAEIETPSNQTCEVSFREVIEVQILDSVDDAELISPRRKQPPIIKDNNITRTRLTSTCEASRPVNKKKKFSGDETLDTKRMRMMDMIYWNPKNERALLKKKESSDTICSAIEPQPTGSPTKPSAPQVKVGPDGKLILDETSLYIAETQQDISMWETIDDDRLSRKVTSLSFRNRLWRKGTAWTKKEDELFYELIRCTGTDFGLMHQFFPSRARNELKSKFNREERNNWEKMKEVMSLPSVFDESLRDRAEALAREIEKEAEDKRRKKEKGFRTGKREKSVQSEEWNEKTANLVDEAEQIITDLQRQEPLGSDENNINDTEGDCDVIPTVVIDEPRTPEPIAATIPKKPISANAKRILEATMRVVGRKKPMPKVNIPRITRSKPKGYV